MSADPTEDVGWVATNGDRPGKAASCDINVTPTVELSPEEEEDR